MTNNQKEFANFIFQELYNDINDEYGIPYVEVYQYEIEELIKNMWVDLKSILLIFGEITAFDISRVFVLHFWDRELVTNRSIDNINNISHKFANLYGNGLCN